MNRALLEGQLLPYRMPPIIYKHLLGWPVTLDDFKDQDAEYYQNLKQLQSLDDVSDLCLDFTITEQHLGRRWEVELVEGGSLMEVTNENLFEYLQATVKYRMFQRTQPQLTELLLGFLEVVPEPALTVLDAAELEQMLHLPVIDVDEWQAMAHYAGDFEAQGQDHLVVQWFWEIVRDDYDAEMVARLLRFVTGTSWRGLVQIQETNGFGKIFPFTMYGERHPLPSGSHGRKQTSTACASIPPTSPRKNCHGC